MVQPDSKFREFHLSYQFSGAMTPILDRSFGNQKLEIAKNRPRIIEPPIAVKHPVAIESKRISTGTIPVDSPTPVLFCKIYLSDSFQTNFRRMAPHFVFSC